MHSSMLNSGRCRRIQTLAAVAGVAWCSMVAVLVIIYRYRSEFDNYHSITTRSNSRRSGSILSDDQHLRDCVTGVTIGRVLDTSRSLADVTESKRNEAASRELSVNTSQAFKSIFDRKYWGVLPDTHSGISASGGGSALTFTHEVMATLHAVITELKRKYGLERIRLLDMPCGDMGWMSRFLETRIDVDYTGVDIVKDLIDHHQAKYADRPWKFIHLDFVNHPIQFRQYHLILCRMVLQHLPDTAVLHLLSRMSATDVVGIDSQVATAVPASYLLTTTFNAARQNNDIVAGSFRSLNLELPPVALRQPLCLSLDGPRSSQHFLGLWDLPLRTVPNCNMSVNVVAAFGSSYAFHSCSQLSP